MKMVKLVLAVLMALWTVGVAIGAVRGRGTHQGVRGTTDLFAGIGVTAVCAVVTIWLFQSALRKP